nr:Gfo/Idh/MocA family oxidoreductase [Desulfobulbaceae bacterium]
MSKTYKLGILGCGDFLRWQVGSIKSAANVEVAKLFDPDKANAEKFAAELGGSVATSEDEVLTSKNVDIICLFVPPFLRKELTRKAVENNKQIIATKPMAPNKIIAEEIRDIIGNKVKCGFLYCRTNNALVKTAKEIFDSGELGKLALYRQDWLHHYPAWNNWALDPEKNGGPFMDAMIHNLNISRYLMDSPATKACFFADNLSHQDLKCSDTDMMKVDFAGGGAAYLFITWAAELAVYSTAGNDREHIDILYMITDQGWRITHENGKLVASKNGEKKEYSINGYEKNIYERFADSLTNNSAIPEDMADVNEACKDITIVSACSVAKGNTIKI